MITINYLPYTKNRKDFYLLTFYFLNKIKPENKKLIKLNILANDDENIWKERCQKNLNNIKYNIKIFGDGFNYLNKIKYAISDENEFSIKLDEDCFINNHIFDYLIENINILNNTDNLLLGTLLSHNIPTCDYFIDGFFDEKNKLKIHQYFLNQEMPRGLFNVDYSPLNKYTIHSKEWNYSEYYNGLNMINTELKGMHPIRISWQAQFFMNEYIISNIEKLIEKKEYNIINIEAPYFNNSFFAIKTNVWANIILKSSNTDYDEVAINIYKKKENKKFLFIDKSYSIHTMYNTIFGNQNIWKIGSPIAEKEEINFYNKLVQKIINK